VSESVVEIITNCQVWKEIIELHNCGAAILLANGKAI